MRKRYCFFVVCLSLVAAAASAQTVQDSNALVFYFDQDATVRSWYGTGETTAYLIAGPLFDFDGTPYDFLNSWGVDGIGVTPLANLAWAVLTPRGAASPGSHTFSTESTFLGFTYSEPLPLSGRTVIAQLSLNVVSTEPTYLIPCTLNGGSYEVEGVQRWFETPRNESDGPEYATATINGLAPLATDSADWGSVKALFR